MTAIRLCPIINWTTNCIAMTSLEVCVEQNGKRYILKSNTLFSSYVCEMDSGLLKYANYTKRCDYGLYVIENDSAYLIELKGQKINVAIQQINATLALLHDTLKNITSVNARVVAHNSVPRSIKFSLLLLERLMMNTYRGSFKWTSDDTMIDVIVI